MRTSRCRDCARSAHNAAWDELDFATRYRDHLSDAPAARQALDDLAQRLATGEDIVLVCYENTEQKRCHRTLLMDELRDK